MPEQQGARIETPAPELQAKVFSMRDGRRVLLRPVRTEDANRLVRLCDRLSEESSRFRFFRAGRRLTPREALGVVTVDREHNEAVVAVDGDEVVAWGSFNQLGNDPSAEITLLVDDAYQGVGLGREVLERLIEAARERHYVMLLAELMPDNDRMLQLLESAGLPYFADEYFGVIRVHVFLQRPYL
jgi:GNAT superfamily N-acetyltransferase